MSYWVFLVLIGFFLVFTKFYWVFLGLPLGEMIHEDQPMFSKSTYMLASRHEPSDAGVRSAAASPVTDADAAAAATGADRRLRSSSEL